SDKYVKNFFAHPPASSRELHERINSLYFSGYFSKYDIKVFPYDSVRHPIYKKDSVPYARFNDIFDSTFTEEDDADL
ncbi:hypothetical protein ABTL48_21495, partial [Acinetobacter baumannii]